MSKEPQVRMTGELALNFKPSVNSEQLHNALDRVLELHGCPTCGLVGLDLRFQPSIPEIKPRFERIEGLAGATLFRR